MAKKKFYKNNDTNEYREQLRDFYHLKYRNLFYTRIRFGGITDDQSKYILRKYWYEGQVAFKTIPHTNEFYFCPFSVNSYNIYDLPASIYLINVYDVPYIPNTPQKVNEDAVIGYANHLRLPVKALVMPLINKLVDVEMKIRTNLALSSLPFLCPVQEEDREHARTIINRLFNDELAVFMEVNDIGMFKSGIATGTEFLVDRLYKYKQQIENEILTALGVDNIGGIEKAERLVLDEVNSNNDLIETHADTYLEEMKGFCERIKETFGIDISVELNIPMEQTTGSKYDEEGVENDD